MLNIKTKIFKPIKEIDAEIRTIETIKIEEDLKYLVNVGLYESLGEQGEILTLDYDTLPTESEIIEDVKDYLAEMKTKLENSLLSAREEKYLKMLEKVV